MTYLSALKTKMLRHMAELTVLETKGLQDSFQAFYVRKQIAIIRTMIAHDKGLGVLNRPTVDFYA